jgi:hypothetical protein
MPGVDEFSQAIGKLIGQVEALDRYTHEREHGINNLAQKVEGLGTRITRDIAAVEGRIEGRIRAMDDRLIALEKAAAHSKGAQNLATAILQSPAIGWLFAAIVALAAWWRAGKL